MTAAPRLVDSLRAIRATDDAAIEGPLPSAVRAADVLFGDPVAFRAGLMTTADLGYFAGEDGSMKSTLALNLAGAIAGGYRFLNKFATEQAPVLIVSEEDADAVLRNRLEAMCRGADWNADAVLANVHLIARAEVSLTSHAWRLHLLTEIERIGAALVVLDPLAELITGEENSNSDARAVVKTMRSLSKPTAANVLVVHHFGKPSEGKQQKDMLRGASAYGRASRFTYAIEHDADAHEIKVTCLKLSRGQKPAPFVVRYIIESDPANPAQWTLARFDYVTAQVAILDRAEAFVLDQLGTGDRMNTTELRDAAKGTGVSGADIGRALKTLSMRQRIDYLEGPKGAKQWGLVCLPGNQNNQKQPENLVAGQAPWLPGNQSDAVFCLPSPYGGKQEPADTELPATSEVGA